MFLASGCSLLLSFESFGECRDGACTDAVDGGSDEAASVCKPYKWPTLVEASTGTSQPSRTYALQTIAFGSLEDGGVPLYDLNNRCVCPGGTRTQASCRQKEAGKVPCDDFITGADNRFSELFSQFRGDPTVAFFSDSEVTNAIRAGAFTLLVQIDDYNGLQSDSKVAVSLFNALRVESDAGPIDDAGMLPALKPTFERTERWVTDRTFLKEALTTSKFTSFGAYVADRTLVAEFQDVELGLFLPRLQRFTLKVKDVRIIMKVPSDPELPTQAAFLGRLPAQEILFLGGKLGWCPNAKEDIDKVKFSVLRSEACNNADLSASGDDLGSADCDAISTNMQFTMVPALPPARSEIGVYPPTPCPNVACP